MLGAEPTQYNTVYLLFVSMYFMISDIISAYAKAMSISNNVKFNCDSMLKA